MSNDPLYGQFCGTSAAVAKAVAAVAATAAAAALQALAEHSDSESQQTWAPEPIECQG